MNAIWQNIVKKLDCNSPIMRGYVEENLRIQAMKEFYLGSGAKYTEAAKDFFKQV